MPILEVRELEKFYGRRKVVDGVNFDVDAGEVVGLLGPNGAGKTTSFRMTTGQVTPDGGKVVVRSRVLSNSIQLVIADTGIGIAPQSLTRLGRPFEQVESQLTKTYHGSGLGLAIARSLTKLHGGSMRMRSKLGAGTVVCVSLPRDPRKGAAKISVAA